MSDKEYAALEIGTTRTILAIAEEVNGRLKVTHVPEIISSGIHKSQIHDINQATQSVKSVLNEINKIEEQNNINLTIANAYLVTSDCDIKADTYESNTMVNGTVTDDNIADVQDLSDNANLPNDREILEITPQYYELDNLSNISAPKGMSGRLLRFHTLHIHASKDRINDARKAAENALIEIVEPLFAASCAARAVTDESEKKNGILVLDLGGGTTGYALYSDGYLLDAGVIGVGGDHITNDIAHAFQTNNSQAEKIKCSEASAVISSDTSRVKIPNSGIIADNRTISRHSLDTVVNARVKELLAIIRETLEEKGSWHLIHRGIVITGGGASLKGIHELIEQEYGLQVRTGKPIYVDGLESLPHPEAYASVAGALMYAHENDTDRGSFLGDLIGRFFK